MTTVGIECASGTRVGTMTAYSVVLVLETCARNALCMMREIGDIVVCYWGKATNLQVDAGSGGDAAFSDVRRV